MNASQKHGVRGWIHQFAIVVAAGAIGSVGAIGCGDQASAPGVGADNTGATSSEPFSIAITVTTTLPTCNSSLSGQVAFVTSTAGLFSCSGSPLAWHQIACTATNAGQVAFAVNPQALFACIGGAWSQVTLQGQQGPQGPQGQPGQQGPTGQQGQQGQQGQPGQQGPAGQPGQPGPQGPQGPAGQAGQQGPAGAKGATGATGPAGPVGATGATGPAGPVGAKGATGATGATGVMGVPGATGATGAMGTTGATGATGPAGPTGVMGVPGATGATGPAGAKSLVLVTPEPSGTNCANGGEKIEVGIDTNNDGVLGMSEVQQTAYVCNGGGGCGMGLEGCGASCVNLSSDPNNCGSCGTVCSSGSVCTAGACTPVTCSAGKSVCNDSCVDLGSDDLNCGGCGVVCGSGTSCGGGSCVDINFGNVPVNTSVTKQVTITIDAGYFIELVFLNQATSPPFTFDFGTCATSAGTGPGTCQINETFAPTVAGALTPTLTLQECLLTDQSSCVDIPGTIYANGVDATFGGPPTVDFGTVPINTSVTKSIPVKVDTGYFIELVFLNEATSPPFTFDFGSCATSAGTGPGTCNVTETLAPTTAGPIAVQLALQECLLTDNSSCITLPTNLTANAVDATTTLTPVSFGNVPLNTSVTKSIPITVDTGYFIELVFLNEATSPPFTFDFGTCGTSAGTGPGICNINETFAPTTPVNESVTLVLQECLLTDNATCLNLPVPITANGVSEGSASGG
jgi:Collagen triple helix repeat (20 copies)/Stigma-specific protein, Stig1